jgi:IMP dehydrogenase
MRSRLDPPPFKIVEALTYDDVLLVPQFSDIESRSEVDLSVDLGNGVLLGRPIISSPMDTITEDRMAVTMDTLQMAGIIHRYNTPQQQAEMVRKVKDRHAANVGAAIGVTGDFEERAALQVAAGASIICLDVAHGQHSLMRKALKILRVKFPDIHLMAGNVATREGFDALAEWGANSVRCNIGGGSICTTRIQTGHGVPGLHTIMDCAQSQYTGDVKIIADGGIRNSGDIVKAIAAGADVVMIGSLLSGTAETPGQVIHDGDSVLKAYRGMASPDAQNDWRGRVSSVEGIATTVPFVGPAKRILKELEAGLRSGMSYSGARTIQELQVKAQFIRQTHAGQGESKAHIREKA